ncbi:MAG: DJ-1/PfpI family protein [Candidatus Peribacteraceae bacterium]|nr:DJ-1/PfpI family protein [Candidatus Peribacteraceae bacterium]
MKHALFIIAPENFRDEELFVPQEVLEKNGVTTTIASREAGTCHGKLGGEAEAVIGLNQVNAEDFDVIIFVGGPGSQTFRDDPAALLLAQKAVASGKILAAICAAPTILAAAGVLDGRAATVFPDENYEKFLTEKGAILSKNPVEVDGKIITANGPEAGEEFAESILDKL